MKTVLVTGANGFLGFYLVRQLLQNGYNVVATGKGPNRLPFTNTNLLYQSLDYTINKVVTAVIEKMNPAVIIHCGALSKPDECELNKEAAYRANVTGTSYLLRAADAQKADFLFLSTDFVFSGDKGLYREEDIRAPVNYYGTTKLLAEDEVAQYPYRWTIVRTVLAYGRSFSGRNNLVTLTADALREGKSLNIFTDQLRTPTYIDDLAAGIVTLVNHKAGGIFHLSGEEVKTPYDVSVETARYLGLNTSLIRAVKENEFHQPARRPAKTGFDISKAKRELGFQPVSFTEGLRRTFL